jgi:hypothetical protein
LKTIRLIVTFYKGFAAASLSLSAICAYIYYSWNTGVLVIMPLFWFKAAFYVLVWYYIKTSKRKEFYYYHALGISKRVLWTSAISLDFTLYILVMILTNKLSHA